MSVGKWTVAELMGQIFASNNSSPTLTFNTGTLVDPSTGLTVFWSIDGHKFNLIVGTGSA